MMIQWCSWQRTFFIQVLSFPLLYNTLFKGWEKKSMTGWKEGGLVLVMLKLFNTVRSYRGYHEGNPLEVLRLPLLHLHTCNCIVFIMLYLHSLLLHLFIIKSFISIWCCSVQVTMHFFFILFWCIYFFSIHFSSSLFFLIHFFPHSCPHGTYHEIIIFPIIC